MTAIILYNARVVLFARYAAEYFGIDESTAATRYYGENNRLLGLTRQ
jgi:hypothetical protein